MLSFWLKVYMTHFVIAESYRYFCEHYHCIIRFEKHDANCTVHATKNVAVRGKTVPCLGTNSHQRDVIMTSIVDLDGDKFSHKHLISDIRLVQIPSQAWDSFWPHGRISKCVNSVLSIIFLKNKLRNGHPHRQKTDFAIKHFVIYT